MSELKLDLLCIFGAMVGCNVVVVPFLGIATLADYMFVPKSRVAGEQGFFPSEAELTGFFVTALLFPIACIAGALLGWAWTVKRIRRRYPKYEIL